ncbi:hypothetical protein BBP40_009189 [Aspergillus hancockii]|nr:hypothetical protein BBP40_009189 [Aspergillus hancockii]
MVDFMYYTKVPREDSKFAAYLSICSIRTMGYFTATGGAYLSRTSRCETARCNCDLGNQTVIHVLLDCPLHQDEHDLMRSALSDQGVALRRDELLTRSDARTIVAEFIIKTAPLGQFQAVDTTTLGVEEGDE